MQSPTIRISLYTVHMWIMNTDKKKVLNLLSFFVSESVSVSIFLSSHRNSAEYTFFGITWWWINKISTKRNAIPSIYVNGNKHCSKIISHLNCVLYGVSVCVQKGLEDGWRAHKFNGFYFHFMCMGDGDRIYSKSAFF